MSLTITLVTPLTDDDRRILTAVLGIDPGPSHLTLTGGTSPLALATAQGTATSAASETEPDAGAPGDGTGLDADGLPWDDQIHSSNKKKNADGRWQRRRGVADSVVEARVAVLRAGGASLTQTAEVFATPAGEVPAPPAPVAEVPAPPAPPAPTATATAGEWDGSPGFLKVMKLITAKKLPAERLNALLADVGLAPSTTALLKADAATRETFAAMLDAEG